MVKSFVEVITNALQLGALWSNAVDGVVVCGNKLLAALTQLLSTRYVILSHKHTHKLSALTTLHTCSTS